MALQFRPFTMADYDDAYSLWNRTEGVGLSQADEPQNLARFLARNPGLSFVAEEEGRIVGAVLCGNDGRRGFLHHLAVEKASRRSGIGRSLVERCLSALAAAGLRKCHLFVLADNVEGQRFWRTIGWEERTTLKVMSRDVDNLSSSAAPNPPSTAAPNPPSTAAPNPPSTAAR
jgi:ribosomal protein S18 acetylase RimI-like enzyme